VGFFFGGKALVIFSGRPFCFYKVLKMKQILLAAVMFGIWGVVFAEFAE